MREAMITMQAMDGVEPLLDQKYLPCFQGSGFL